MTKHKVLIPLDGSPFSRQVVPTICRLLDPAEYAVILLRVGEQPKGLGSMPPRPLGLAWPTEEYGTAQDAAYARHPIYANQVEQSSRAELAYAVAVEQHALQAAGYQVVTMVRFGDPAREITDVVNTTQADLVAMATHGRTGLSHLLMGSVAAQVLQTVQVPLLLVRPDAGTAATLTVAAPHTIVVPLDGSAFAEQALPEAQELAASSGAGLVLVAAIATSSDIDAAATGIIPDWVASNTQVEQERLSDYLMQIKERLAVEGFQVEARLLVGPPAEVIIHVSEKEHADLIVMATHGRGGLGRLFLGSVATEVVHNAEQPVLLVRPRQQPTHPYQQPEEERLAARSVTR